MLVRPIGTVVNQAVVQLSGHMIFFFALFNFIVIVKCISWGISTKYHENTITYTNTKHSTWIFLWSCCPSYFRGEDHVAVYRTEKVFSSNARPLSVSSHDLYWEIKMYWARRPITEDLFGKQSLAFGLGIAIGSFPQIISPKHSHNSSISQRRGIRTINPKIVCSAPVRSARTFLESSVTQWWTSRTTDQEVVGSTPVRCARAFSDFSKSF